MLNKPLREELIKEVAARDIIQGALEEFKSRPNPDSIFIHCNSTFRYLYQYLGPLKNYGISNFNDPFFTPQEIQEGLPLMLMPDIVEISATTICQRASRLSYFVMKPHIQIVHGSKKMLTADKVYFDFPSDHPLLSHYYRNYATDRHTPVQIISVLIDAENNQYFYDYFQDRGGGYRWYDKPSLFIHSVNGLRSLISELVSPSTRMRDSGRTLEPGTYTMIHEENDIPESIYQDSLSIGVPECIDDARDYLGTYLLAIKKRPRSYVQFLKDFFEFEVPSNQFTERIDLDNYIESFDFSPLWKSLTVPAPATGKTQRLG